LKGQRIEIEIFHNAAINKLIQVCGVEVSNIDSLVRLGYFSHIWEVVEMGYKSHYQDMGLAELLLKALVMVG
jgi:hypothetical protein